MMRRLVRAAIQNATVTRSEGLTLRIDPVILRAANILPLEEVEIVHHETGQRFITFAEEAGEGSGEVASLGHVRPLRRYVLRADYRSGIHAPEARKEGRQDGVTRAHVLFVG